MPTPEESFRRLTPSEQHALLSSVARTIRRDAEAARLFPTGSWPPDELSKRREAWRLFTAIGQTVEDTVSLISKLAERLGESVEWVAGVLLEAHERQTKGDAT